MSSGDELQNPATESALWPQMPTPELRHLSDRGGPLLSTFHCGNSASQSSPAFKYQTQAFKKGLLSSGL